MDRLPTDLSHVAAPVANRLKGVDRLAIAVFALVAVGIAAGGLALARRERARSLDAAHELLAADATLKVRQIAEWRSERTAGARALADWPGLSAAVMDWQRRTDDPSRRARVVEYLVSSKRTLGYVDLFLASVDGRVQLAAGLTPDTTDPADREAVLSAVRTRGPVMTGLHPTPAGEAIDVATPVFDPAGASVVAALITRSDPNRSLYPLLETAPAGRRTVESVLVRGDGRSALVLSHPRGRPTAQLWRRVPAEQAGADVVQAVAGRRGRVDGVNGDGAAVVSDIRTVPGLPWLLVTAIDRDEALEGATAREGAIAAFVTLTILLTGTAVFAAMRRRERNAYRALYEGQLEHMALARHYEFVLKYAPDVVLLTRTDGAILSVNDRVFEIHGYRPEELVGHHVSSLRAPDALADFAAQWGMVTGPEAVVYETTHRRRDGTVFPVEVNARVIDIDGHSFRHHVIRDITVRKEAEQALRAGEVRYRLLFNNSNDAILVHRFDAAGLPATFIEANDVACRRLGYSRDELLRMSPLDIDSPQSKAKLGPIMQRLHAEGRLVWEGEHVAKDGRVIPVEISNDLFDFNGEWTALATVRDISERKRAEAALKASQDLLVQAQKMEAVGRLAGGVAHDFNNLLSVIVNYAAFGLEELPREDPRRAYFDEIHRASERAAQLTNQLLAFSRRQVFQVRVVNLNDTIAHLEPMLGRLIGEDVHLVTMPGEALPAVLADASQLDQVVMNLVVNARDAMPEGGTLVIATSVARIDAGHPAAHSDIPPGDYVVLSVTDTGHGMDEETRARVFEPFFTTKSAGKGTGLGLATVYGIVKQSGGTVSVESEPGRGSTFTVHLPVHRAAPAHAQDVKSPETTVADRPGGTERLLVVEDEDAVRDLAARILTSAGYEVVRAAHGAEALQACRNAATPFDLLVTDVVMPQMSGPVLAERVRQFWPDISVLYLSGYTEDAIVHHGILDPGVEFLSKPFTAETLTRKVRAVLDRGSAEQRRVPSGQE